MLPVGILGGIVGAVASIAVPWLLGAARQWVPRWFGFLRIAYVRTAAATVGGLAIATGINLSTSDHSHKELTYIVWYGIGALGFVVALAVTIVIDHRIAEAPAEQAAPERSRSPISPADRARIARETEQRIANEIHDPDLRYLDDRNSAQSARQSPSLPLSDLADQLGRFKEHGVAIRRAIKPPTGYATSSISVLNQMMPALAEQRVRSWSATVRAYLESRAPRFLVILDEGPDLPRPHVFASVVPTTKQPELLAFLDHKLTALDQIIRTILMESS